MKRSVGFMLGALSAPLSTLAAPQWGSPSHTVGTPAHFAFSAYHGADGLPVNISINFDPSTLRIGTEENGFRQYVTNSYTATATRRSGELTVTLGTYNTGTLYLSVADNSQLVTLPAGMPADALGVRFTDAVEQFPADLTFDAGYYLYTGDTSVVNGLGLDQFNKFAKYVNSQTFENWNWYYDPIAPFQGTPVPTPGAGAVGAAALALGRRRRVSSLSMQATSPELA